MKRGVMATVTEVPYSYADMVAHEIGGGVWFLISIFLSIAFLIAIKKELSNQKGRYTPLIWAALALVSICIGSAMRGFLTWMQFMYQLNGWDHSVWVRTWPWFALSVFLNTVGCMVGIWILTPKAWRRSFALGSFVVSFSIPTALFFLL
jgi:hypothetical protein